MENFVGNVRITDGKIESIDLSSPTREKLSDIEKLIALRNIVEKALISFERDNQQSFRKKS